MEFDIDNLSKKEFLEYLKSIKVDAENKHIEVARDSFTFSIVMITTTTKCNGIISRVFDVYVIALKNDEDFVADNLKFEEFKDINEAEKYFNKLLEIVRESTIEYLLAYFELQ